MPENHVKFHSANGKRLLLIVEDEELNREMLEHMLSDQYDVIGAENGEIAFQIIRERHEEISLILLDLFMPKMHGHELLGLLQNDAQLKRIPVIVMTSDQSAEVESLNLGAIDFISKPFLQPGVIRARIQRIIELSEDRDIIQLTERDHVTDLYNKEYFFRYAQKYDQHHRTQEMDAIVLDINHFHLINERYGKAYGDEVLSRVGKKLQEIAWESGGMVCRRQADTFLLYCPHGADYEKILEKASVGLLGEERNNTRIRLRMGVYSNADKSIDIERRFDRAKTAADTVKASFRMPIAFYDNALHEAELFAEQLLEDFQDALKEEQFQIYYQPKFDIRPEIPVLKSAEALVRWRHPRLGMINPGLFIPLFEDNGLILDLDCYVWRKAAAQVRDWRDRFGITIPVSVNVSRIDMYDPHLVDTLHGIVLENDLTPRDYLLEITESAYTQDSLQIIETVNQLRALGFQIEMDDFGTGYSSLNMISTLPVDALKLDMQFVRNAFNERQDTRMLEVILEIADYLSVPVIAEGVETEEQLHALKAMGCDIVQGYYFSRPVPPDEYEHFILEKKEMQGEEEEADHLQEERRSIIKKEEVSFGKIAHALSSGFEVIYYVDTYTGHYVEFSSRGKYEDLQIQRSGADFFADTQENLCRVVYPEDQKRVSLSLKKEALMDQVMTGGHFSMTYRLVIDDEPVYYNLKAVKANTHDQHHLVIGVSNVNLQMQEAIVDRKYLERIERSYEFFHIAQALSSDFESVYYIDIDSNAYNVFTAQGEYEKLRIETNGEDFFEETQRNLKHVIYPEDIERVSRAMEKEQLLSMLNRQRVFSIEYRLMIEDTPVPYQLKAVRVEGDGAHHIVVGVSNIEHETLNHASLAIWQENVTYANISQALAADYISIYYVDTRTDHFVEYSASEEYRRLGIERSGSDFFNLSRKNIERVVYPEDHGKILEIFKKDIILDELDHNRTFTLTYRLMLDEEPTYVNMKAMRMEDHEDPHIVFGISNVDAQMQREQAYEHELGMAKAAAHRDALTGVKNKFAYEETEEALNEKISAGELKSFSLVVCDLNGLKVINDTMGHKEGDRFIRNASRIICTIFKHSPVFRIGGDEFAVILQGQDFENRASLIRQMKDTSERNKAEGGIVIAYGIADFIPLLDKSVESVFVRADDAMYLCKKDQKK